MTNVTETNKRVTITTKRVNNWTFVMYAQRVLAAADATISVSVVSDIYLSIYIRSMPKKKKERKITAKRENNFFFKCNKNSLVKRKKKS